MIIIKVILIGRNNKNNSNNINKGNNNKLIRIDTDVHFTINVKILVNFVEQKNNGKPQDKTMPNSVNAKQRNI